MNVQLELVNVGEKLTHICHGDRNLSSFGDVSPTVQKVCAALQVTATILNAVATYPGSDCDDRAFAETTRSLMQQSSVLASAAAELLDVQPGDARYGNLKSVLRQRAAEVVSAQHRVSHAAGTAAIPLERFIEAYRGILDSCPEAESNSLSSELAPPDLVATKRLALLGVVAEVHEAVTLFNYFSPDPETLVEKGALTVLSAANAGLMRILPAASNDAAHALAAQSMLERGGELYASTWKSAARKDVLQLQKMEPVARMRHLYLHQETGLPTQHIDTAFNRMMGRMLDMVCEAVPELRPATVMPEVQMPIVTQATKGAECRP